MALIVGIFFITLVLIFGLSSIYLTIMKDKDGKNV